MLAKGNWTTLFPEHKSRHILWRQITNNYYFFKMHPRLRIIYTIKSSWNMSYPHLCWEFTGGLVTQRPRNADVCLCHDADVAVTVYITKYMDGCSDDWNVGFCCSSQNFRMPNSATMWANNWFYRCFLWFKEQASWTIAIKCKAHVRHSTKIDMIHQTKATFRYFMTIAYQHEINEINEYKRPPKEFTNDNTINITFIMNIVNKSPVFVYFGFWNLLELHLTPWNHRRYMRANVIREYYITPLKHLCCPSKW